MKGEELKELLKSLRNDSEDGAKNNKSSEIMRNMDEASHKRDDFLKSLLNNGSKDKDDGE